MPTHVEPGRRGGAYVMTPWSLQHIDPTGHVRTLAGFRHRKPPTVWYDKPDLEVVGDWNGISAARQGFWEAWRWAWRQSSLAVDESAAPMDNGGIMEQPHKTGPIGYVADYRFNRICTVQFAKDSHSAPAQVSELITDLKGPWAVVNKDDYIIISERDGNQLRVCDAFTGQTISTIPWARPEGLFIMDNMLYVGSSSTRDIKKVPLDMSAPPVLVCNVPWSLNARYVVFALSDGSFGPRGLIGIVTWDNAGYGYPYLFMPDGKRIDDWLWSGTVRKGPPWLGQHGMQSPGYPTCVAFGDARMYAGTSQEGLMVFSRALISDPDTPTMTTALRQWFERGYQNTHGHWGFGHYGLPLPWGETPEIDAMLRIFGH
jgi:hypothetical protein